METLNIRYFVIVVMRGVETLNIEHFDILVVRGGAKDETGSRCDGGGVFKC